MLKNINDIIDYLKLDKYLNVSFHKPDSFKLKKLKENYVLPNSYEKFLTITDGIQFFNSGDHDIYCIDDVIEFNKYKTFKKNVYLIGFFLDNDLVIDSNKISSENYLYAGSTILLNEFISLGNLENFFINLIKNKGDIYWNYINKQLYNFENET